LQPELEKASIELKGKVAIGKVDATEEKELATKYNIKGFPTMVWFEDGKETEYDGGRTSDTIIEWVKSMTGPAVIETNVVPEPAADKPRIVLHADSLFKGFEDAAKANRRKAVWYFLATPGASKVVLQHLGEDAIELIDGVSDQAKLTSFLTDNALPLFGKLDGETFDKYMEAAKGLVWSLFPNEDGGITEVEKKYRSMMEEVARKVKGRYFVTYTDTDKFKEAVDSMLGVSDFPAIAVQKKAGDKKKFVHNGEMTEQAISQFIADVDSGKIDPKLKSEPVPVSNDEPVRVVVGSTLQSEVFTADKDVMLEVYAPWCGHCKKLEPEYVKLAKKVKKEELTDLLMIAKIDGTANDSPVDSIEWSSFPEIFYAKAGSSEPLKYDGERTAKGLWKYIKKHASKAQEIRERLERRKGNQKRIEEL
jgi:protein disulfide-isomerase/protein disulfide-isomerase A1